MNQQKHEADSLRSDYTGEWRKGRRSEALVAGLWSWEREWSVRSCDPTAIIARASLFVCFRKMLRLSVYQVLIELTLGSICEKVYNI